LSGLSPAEAYRRGDFNGDAENDHADFIRFKEVFEVANGAGSFQEMLASIPEPSTVMLVFAAGLFAVPRARRSTQRK
jgi:hypothetical protein